MPFSKKKSVNNTNRLEDYALKGRTHGMLGFKSMQNCSWNLWFIIYLLGEYRHYVNYITLKKYRKYAFKITAVKSIVQQSLVYEYLLKIWSYDLISHDTKLNS